MVQQRHTVQFEIKADPSDMIRDIRRVKAELNTLKMTIPGAAGVGAGRAGAAAVAARKMGNIDALLGAGALPASVLAMQKAGGYGATSGGGGASILEKSGRIIDPATGFAAGAAVARRGLPVRSMMAKAGGFAKAAVPWAGAAAAGMAVTSLTRQMMTSAAEIQKLRRQYETLFDSAIVGAKELDKTLRFARTTPFTGEDMAHARRLMKAFQFDSMKTLRVIADTAAATGKPIQEIVRAMGWMKAGLFGESFEALRRIGVSRAALEARGATFTKAGRYTGTPDVLMDIVLQEFVSRFGGASERIAQDFSIRIQNLGAEWRERFMFPLGRVIQEVLTPAVELLHNTVASFGNVAEQLLDIFGPKQPNLAGTKARELLGQDIPIPSMWPGGQTGLGAGERWGRAFLGMGRTAARSFLPSHELITGETWGERFRGFPGAIGMGSSLAHQFEEWADREEELAIAEGKRRAKVFHERLEAERKQLTVYNDNRTYLTPFSNGLPTGGAFNTGPQP